jgi:branched-chain amino acid transport system permease protein
MSYFFQLVVSGIVVGSIYALSALGFVLIYKSSKVLNIAHGQIIAAGAFIAYALTGGGNPDLYFLFAEHGDYLFPGHERGADIFAAADRRAHHLRHHGNHRPDVHSRRVDLLPDTVWLRQFFFPPVSAQRPDIVRWGVHLLDPAGGCHRDGNHDRWIFMVFQKSTVGISMRAVSDDQFASMSVGISVPRVFGLAWATAGLSAAAAGAIIGNITGLNFETLQAFGITVFPVVILGGWIPF